VFILAAAVVAWILSHRLPPAPYNKNILVGNPVNKDWWWQSRDFNLTREEQDREEFFVDTFGDNFHIYAQGQCYLMSTDLAYFVAQELQRVLEEGQFYNICERKRQAEQDKRRTKSKAKLRQQKHKRKLNPTEENQQILNDIRRKMEEEEKEFEQSKQTCAHLNVPKDEIKASNKKRKIDSRKF